VPAAAKTLSPPRPASRRRRRWRVALAIVVGLPLLAAVGVTSYYYVYFARIIDARLQGERVRALPRVLARPFEIRRGQWLSTQALADRLNDLGYAQRPSAGRPEPPCGSPRSRLISSRLTTAAPRRSASARAIVDLPENARPHITNSRFTRR